MATSRISVIIDLVADKATRGAQSFRQSIEQADGAVGKFKAGASSAFASVQANAGELALAGGAALVAFGAKAVTEFQNLALESGRLSEALGLTVEEASRYIEVAGDLGIESSSLEAALGKMNQTAGKTPGAFEKIGAELQRNRDGSINVSETFLATVDALRQIEDPFKRAAAAQDIFGRSWRDAAELITRSSDDIRDSLAEVSDEKIIDDDELRKAREFRAAMDELNDAVQDITLALGEGLVPKLTTLATAVSDLKTAGDFLPGWLKDGYDSFERIINPVSNVTYLYGELRKMIAGEVNPKLGEMGDKLRPIPGWTDDVAIATEDLTDEAISPAVAALERYNEELAELRGALDVEKATRDLGDAFDKAEFAALNAKTATEQFGAESWEAAAAARDQADANLELKDKVLDYAESVGGIPPQRITQMFAAIDNGSVRQVEATLANLARVRTAVVTASSSVSGSIGFTAKKVHDGGLVGGRSFAGLRDDEVPAILQKGEAVLTPGQQAAMLAAGGSSMPPINVTINAGLGADGQQIARVLIPILEDWQRNGGPTPWGR